MFQNKYNFIKLIVCEYLNNEIITKKRKWNKIWIDVYMHFNNFSNSKCEKKHHNFKNELKSFTNDVRMMIKISNILYDFQRINYRVFLDVVKQRLFNELKKFLYRNFKTYVIFFALKKIDKHYKKLLNAQNNNRKLFVCTKSFNNTISLSCVHIIKKRFANAISEKILKISNVHFHWRFKIFIRYYREFDEFVNVDDIVDNETFDRNFLFQIQNFRITRTKNRFQDSRNRSRISRDKTTRKKNKTTKEKRDYATKRQQIFENITRQIFSTFEYVEIEIIDFIVKNNVKNVQLSIN